MTKKEAIQRLISDFREEVIADGGIKFCDDEDKNIWKALKLDKKVRITIEEI